MEAAAVDTRALRIDAPPTHRPFRSVAVLGAGTMGAQIAAHLANIGLEVHLLDLADDSDNPNSLVQKQFKAAAGMKPDPFFTDEAKKRVRLGTFDHDLDRLGEVDWVIEAVVERLDIKQQLMERVEEAIRPKTVVSTNTSGIPIHEIAEGRSTEFRRRFLGTHFFNPPRYLKLLELIPTPETDFDVLERVAQFGRLQLGKGIVVAKDVPYFIGNRIGTYAMFRAMRYFTDGEYTIEEIDALTGPLLGRPKSATFRTADVVGLDVMRAVAQNLYQKLPHDESRDAFQIPDVLDALLEEGRKGAKTRAGFYKKVDGEIRSVNPSTLEYESPAEKNLPKLREVKKAGDLQDRMRALFNAEGRAGDFFRKTTLDLLSYSARRIPEITESPADVDRAIRWGFGWEMGPFEIWDAIGFESVRSAMEDFDFDVPDWIESMRSGGDTVFYSTGDTGEQEVYLPAEAGYRPDPRPADTVSLAAVKRTSESVLWENSEAALLDIGENVALYEFRSKSNSLGSEVMGGLWEVLDRVENDTDIRGLVIGNEGKNFSVGANLGEVAMAAASGEFGQIEQFLKRFQDVVQRIRYAEKPVVVAAHQRVLGGGCEMVMACRHPVASAETYIGLVELGVGLIPAGTGSTLLAIRAADQSPNGNPSEIQPWLRKYFEQVAMAEVATSARQAQEMHYLAENARIVMDDDRRLFVAREEVIRLSNEGYAPPPVRSSVKVLGRPALAAMKVGADQYLEGGYISEYDAYLAKELAYVLAGGDLSHPQDVHENYLLELEREVFMRLLGDEKTQQRIKHILEHNKPLRN